MSAKPAGFRQDPKALTAEAAEALTARITEILATGYAEVVPLVIKAFRGRAWVGCGFTSWDDYCRERFTGTRMLRIPREAFTEIALTYAEAGMSARAIGSATGSSKDTAARALNKSNRKPADVIGLDDRRQARNRKSSEVRRAMTAHPAGKGRPAWEIVVAAIADAGKHGATYTEVCDVLGWRDGKVTGAISEGSRRGEIEPSSMRHGNVAWVAVRTDVTS